MKTIISLSGGLDSTYVLWKTLSTTDDEVTVLFLDTQLLAGQNLLKYDLRWLDSIKTNFEQKAIIQQICNWLKENIRDFTLIIEKVDSSKFHIGIEKANTIITYFLDIAIEKINAGTVDKVVFSTEKENDGWSHGGTKNNIRNPGSIELYNRFIAEAIRGEISFPLLDNPYTQANALTDMPQELIDLTSSCQISPIYSCNKCFKCNKRKFFCDEIASGKTLEEINQLVQTKSVQEDGTWISMKYWIRGINDKTWSMPQWPTSYKK